MAENSNSAERQLLKAIEGDHVQTSKDTTFFSLIKCKLACLIDFLSSSISSSISSHKVSYKFTMHNASTVMLWVIFVVSFWWFIVLGSGISRFRHMPRLDVSDAKPLLAPLKIVNSALQEYAYYLDIILSRNIFNPIKQPLQDTDSVTGAGAAAGNLKMVGISWSEDRLKRYAMIEDTQSKITYYMQEGDIILGFIVKEIKETQIILTYKGSEVRLQ
jgi:type II secretory pathway component PulC